MTTASIIAAGRTIVGTYHGGAYIELHFDSPTTQAFEVINVWDYATDKAEIKNTPAAVRGQLTEWAEAAGESLDHDLREYALSIR